MICASMLLAGLLSDGPTVESIDSLAKARDVKGISSLIDNLPGGQFNPLTVITTNGAYDCGRFGWRAFEATAPNTADRYVVLSTPLTSEDVGDFLFRRSGSKLHYIGEDDAMGVRVVRHAFDLNFDVPARAVHATDRMELSSTGVGDFVFRMSNEFRVRRVQDSAGRDVPFTQAGGVVFLPKQIGSSTLTVSYDGVVSHPLYSGSITSKEATLTNCYWYPMIARQAAPYELTAHFPVGWVAVGQGSQLGTSPGVAHHRMDLPCVFYSFSAGPYRESQFKDRELTLFAWSPRASKETLDAQAEWYAKVVRFYSQFSPFPFVSYGGLDSPQYGGGALEAYSYATYGGGFPDADAHEPSHTWWGGILNNSYLHSFWNESFAVYSDRLFHREWSGKEGTRLAFIPEGETNAGYDQLACDDSGAAHGPIGSDLGYGKGSHVLYLLEKLIGTEAMYRTLKRFITDQPAGKRVEWSDFELAATRENPEKHLESFFADWLHRPGHLTPSCSATVSPTGVDLSYKPEGKPYRVPLEVLLGYPDGSHETRIFDVREAIQLNIPTKRPPAFISVDPYRYLIRNINPDERPQTFDGVRGQLSVYVDPAHQNWGRPFATGNIAAPSSPDGVLFVGEPATTPAMADLCAKAGFQVSGNELRYRGNTVNLLKGCAEALVDLGNGHVCGIFLGTSRFPPNAGNARVAVFDDLGRMIDGEVEPKTSGFLTFRFSPDQNR